MQQAETQEQFSFIFHNAQNPQTQFSIFQQSAIFGQDIRETPCQQDTQYHPATPKQHLFYILESFGSILAKYMALQIIGIPSTLKQSIEYLNNNIQDLKMVIYNAQVMFESKNQSNEFEQAREEQCIQIQAIIDQIKDDYCKQALSKVLGKIEEVRFPSQYIIELKFKQVQLNLFKFQNFIQHCYLYYLLILDMIYKNIIIYFYITIYQKYHQWNFLKQKLFIFKQLKKIQALRLSLI